MCLWQEVLSSENRIEKRLLMRLENLLMNKQESKKRIGVVAGGPESLLANLVDYQEKIDFWIGCDRGNLYLIEQRIPIDLRSEERRVGKESGDARSRDVRADRIPTEHNGIM